MYAVRVRPARNLGFGQQHSPEVSPGFFCSINDEAVCHGVGPDRSEPRLAVLLDAARVKSALSYQPGDLSGLGRAV